MTLDEYQKHALKTALYSEQEFHNLMHWVLGMSGEAGEIANKVKKIIRDKNAVVGEAEKQEIMKEMGDVLWYLAVLADHLGYKFDEVGQYNIDKLRSRQVRGKLQGSGDNR
jgi:NTP pyrophosphatase (non-canonical NTP hydrolase)